MPPEAMDSWIAKAKSGKAPLSQKIPVGKQAVQVIAREEAKSKGSRIMEIAEAIRPWIMKLLENVRDNEGMLVQPARVRGIALNVAQDIVNEQERKKAGV